MAFTDDTIVATSSLAVVDVDGTSVAQFASAPVPKSFVRTRLGVLTVNPANDLEVAGTAAVGYAVRGPANGLIVEGSVGIGTPAPSGKLDVNGDLAVSGKHALRGSDSWLRLNQDRAFARGVLTPGVFASASLNVGAAADAADPGPGNAVITGKLSCTNLGAAAAAIGAGFADGVAPTNGLIAEGSVGIGTSTPLRPLHVHGGDIHVSGAIAGLSFADRDPNPQIDDTVRGKRWVLYSQDKVARLWASGAGDRLLVNANGDVEVRGALRVLGTIEGTLASTALANGSVTTDKVASNAITREKLAASSVGIAQIERGRIPFTLLRGSLGSGTQTISANGTLRIQLSSGFLATRPTFIVFTLICTTPGGTLSWREESQRQPISAGHFSYHNAVVTNHSALTVSFNYRWFVLSEDEF